MKRHLLLMLATAFLLFAPAVAAQETVDGAEMLEAGEVDTSEYPLLSVDITLPPGISPSDVDSSMFSVTEAGRTTATDAEPLSSGQLDVVLAIDTSGSMDGEALSAAQRAALAFIERLPASARIAVVGFGPEPTIAVPLTDDRVALTAAITVLSAGGETALYDTLVATVGQLDVDTDARTALVVLSDGGDTVSATTLSTATEATASSFDVVHAISLLTNEQDLAALSQIVSGGGSVAEVIDPAALESVYTDVADRITNQYRLRWESQLESDADVELAFDPGGALYVATRLVRIDPQLAAAIEAESKQPQPPSVTEPATPPSSAIRELAPPAAVDEPSTVATSVLWLGLGFVLVAIFGLGLVLFAPRERTRNLAREMRAHLPRRRELGGLGRRAVGAVDSVLRRHPERRMGMALRLERAGLDWTPAEAGAFAIASAAILGLIGFGVIGIVGLVLFPAAGLLTEVLWLNARISKRRDRFIAQLDHTLQLIAGSLRSGFGINQALGMVADESEWPTNEEFTRIQGEVRLGRDLPDALDESARRVDSEDYHWVVQAIEISREVGGNLAEVLDNISNTIRQRNTLRRQVKALSAEGRLSAIILFALPFLLFGWMQISNSSYSDLLLERRGGQIALVAAAGLMVVGGFWLRKITDIKF